MYFGESLRRGIHGRGRYSYGFGATQGVFFISLLCTCGVWLWPIGMYIFQWKELPQM